MIAGLLQEVREEFYQELLLYGDIRDDERVWWKRYELPRIAWEIMTDNASNERRD
jgi:hypothetical protein